MFEKYQIKDGDRVEHDRYGKGTALWVAYICNVKMADVCFDVPFKNKYGIERLSSVVEVNKLKKIKHEKKDFTNFDSAAAGGM